MTVAVIRGDARSLPLPDASVDLICTSPPYFGLRSYTDGGEHYEGQIGSEATRGEWLASLLDATREWVRVLKPSGSIFVNLGDKYGGGIWPSKHGKGATTLERFGPKTGQDPTFPARALTAPKSLLGLPWRYAIACTDQLGLILRRDIIWSKPNGLPESVTDRCRSSHEYLFHFTRLPRYYSAVDEIREPHTGGTHNRRKDGQHSPKEQATIAEGFRRGYFPESYENPLGKLPGSVWSIPSQPLVVPPELGLDHFAAFPMELPRRCVLGWSPPGVCTACGEGRRPVTAIDKPAGQTERIARLTASQYDRASVFGPGTPGQIKSTTFGVDASTLNRRIAGYACACARPDAPTHPSVILDPFGGTGTTALVADVLGRTGITVDRSADYCRLARWRTRDPGERARAMLVPKPPPVPVGQVSLFDLDGEAS